VKGTEEHRSAASACRAVGLAKAEGALHSALQLRRVSTPVNRLRSLRSERRDARGPGSTRWALTELKDVPPVREGGGALFWWGEAPERSNRLTEAVGNAQFPSPSYALKRAEPWSIVGHGSDYAISPA
jgi:hypothetical protein